MRRAYTIRKSLRAFGPLLLLAALPALPAATQEPSGGAAPAASETAFPLAQGAAWVYQGVVRWGLESTGGVREKLIVWKMEVERVIRRGSFVAAVVKGFPRDLDRSRGNTRPTECLIVESGGAKYYRISPASFAKAVARLEDPKDSLGDLVNDSELFLDMPLMRGKKFCDMTGMIRTDEFYCWVVGKPGPTPLAGVKGVPAGSRSAFPVEFLTVGDRTAFDFVPGVGITRYSYQVHGTNADIELHLVEFDPGSR